MHYRNGREAKNGDKIVKLEGGKVVAFGVLHSDACMVDCLHIDDVAELLKEKGLDKRPEGK